MKTIYVGNLPFSTGEKELETLFAEYGTVESARVILDKFSGRSRGFGFVEMPDEAADAAIAKLNGYELDGRLLRVNEAREPRARRDETG